MATLIVRQVDERIVRSLKERAKRHGRSAEAEHRALLEAAFAHPVPTAEELLGFFRRGGAMGMAKIDLESLPRGGAVEAARLDDE